MSTVIVSIAQCPDSGPSRGKFGTQSVPPYNNVDRAISPYDEQQKVPLPPTDTYSSVLRFLRQSFVLGTVQWDLVTS
jgi:hypothetical protein